VLSQVYFRQLITCYCYRQGLLEKVKGLSGQEGGRLRLAVKGRYKKCCEGVYTQGKG
jgi:hypothetical protein